jgi:phage-related protein
MKVDQKFGEIAQSLKTLIKVLGTFSKVVKKLITVFQGFRESREKSKKSKKVEKSRKKALLRGSKGEFSRDRH